MVSPPQTRKALCGYGSVYDRRMKLDSAMASIIHSLANASALVADYCDKAEHNEQVQQEWILRASEILRKSSIDFAVAIEQGLFELYAARLESIERRGVAGTLPEAFDGGSSARQATSWGDLQTVQNLHDRHYHPDVVGLAKCDQLRHHAFHLAKLCAAFVMAQADEDRLEDVVKRRLPDALLFALALATAIGTRLDSTPLRSS